MARAARTLGFPARLTGFLAGHTGALVAQLAREEGLEAWWHRLEHGETRNCLLINHERGDATVINEAGPTLTMREWEAFAQDVEARASQAEAVVLAGSVPPSVPAEAYADLCRALTRRARRVYVDTPGPPLAAVLRDPAGLCLKVNRSELSQALGQSLEEPGRLLALLRSLIGAGAVLAGVTMGAGGAVLATADGAWRAETPKAPLRSSVGSGDSFLAGLAGGHLEGWSTPEVLRLATACGAANAETPYPAVFEAERVAELRSRSLVESLG